MLPLILASQSPNRLNMLAKMNLKPDKVIPADIDESVTFSLLDDRITPQEYRYKLDPAFGRTKRASANFDWATQSVVGSNKDKKWSINNIPHLYFHGLRK